MISVGVRRLSMRVQYVVFRLEEVFWIQRMPTEDAWGRWEAVEGDERWMHIVETYFIT